MTLEDKVHAFRLHLFRRAQELGNVSAACRECGVSRSFYYQLRERFRRYGPDGLHPTRRRGRPGRPPQLEATVERQIVALALSWPTWGPRQLSDQLALRGTRVAESTVYRALRRLGLGTRKERLGLLEAHSAERAGLLGQLVGLDEKTLTESPVFDDWTTKDLLAHVAGWTSCSPLGLNSSWSGERQK